MKSRRLLFILFSFHFVISPQVVCSTEQMSSNETIKQLIEVSQMKANSELIMKNYLDQISGVIMEDLKSKISLKTKKKKLTKQQEELINSKFSQVYSMIENTLKWSTVEPVIIKIYSEELTSNEINGMLEFYSTPAGKAMISKMPLILQKIQEETGKSANETMLKVESVLKEKENGLVK